MRRRTPNPIFRRNLFLAAAAVLSLLAILTSPSVLLCLASAKGLAGAALIVGAGLFAAMGIREFAEALLRGPGHPWYVRPGVPIFLPVAMFSINVLAGFGCDLAFGVFKLHRFIPQQALILELMAMEFLWIALLDWPVRAEHADRGTRPPERSSGKPSFKPFDIPRKGKPF